ncbi:hypothetical protein [Microcoleus sp. Pol12B5]|uniref:hypothetical protein n=1 Tax=Microcoleus sp. Pol12B5 TaxID=3055396 RepID=UPI002FD2B081
MNHEREPNLFTDEEASPFKQFFDFKKFRKTRKAILSGDKLYEWNIKELRDRGYLAPLYFNIQESVFVALPSVVIIKIIDWRYPKPPDASDDWELFQGTFGALCAFVAPFVLTLLASILAKASLKKNDLSPSKIDRARKAYLYFDGAYGLYLQGLLSLVTSLLGWAIWMSGQENSQEPISSEIGLILLLFFLVLLALQSKITLWNIPRQLFKINGYSGQSSPWFKYSYNLLLAVPAITVVNLAFLAFLSGILTVFMMAIKQS